MRNNKLDLLKLLLDEVKNKDICIESYIDKKGNYCSIGYLLRLCGIEDNTLKVLNKSHINNEKIINIDDILNENLSDIKPESHLVVKKVREKVSSYYFDSLDLYNLQYYNDMKTKEQTISYIEELIEKEKYANIVI